MKNPLLDDLTPTPSPTLIPDINPLLKDFKTTPVTVPKIKLTPMPTLMPDTGLLPKATEEIPPTIPQPTLGILPQNLLQKNPLLIGMTPEITQAVPERVQPQYGIQAVREYGEKLKKEYEEGKTKDEVFLFNEIKLNVGDNIEALDYVLSQLKQPGEVLKPKPTTKEEYLQQVSPYSLGLDEKQVSVLIGQLEEYKRDLQFAPKQPTEPTTFIPEAPIAKTQAEAIATGKPDLTSFEKFVTHSPEGRWFLPKVGKVIDITQIGNYFVANIVKDLIEKGEWNTLDNLKNAILLKKKTTFYELVNEYLPQYPGWIRFALGTGLDVFADPGTWVSFFGITKMGEKYFALQSALRKGEQIVEGSDMWDTLQKFEKVGLTQDAIVAGLTSGEEAGYGFRAAIRLQSSIPGIDFNTAIYKGRWMFDLYDKAAEKILNSSSMFKFMKAFTPMPGYGTKFDPETGKGAVRLATTADFDWTTWAEASNKQTANALADYYPDIRKIAEEKGLDVSDVLAGVLHAGERGDDIYNLLPPKLQWVADELGSINKRLYQFDQMLGLEYPELSGDLQYFLHNLKPEVKEAMGFNNPNIVREWSMKHGSMIHRYLIGNSAVELNELWKDNNAILEEIFYPIRDIKQKFPDLYETDPIKLTVQRSQKTIRAWATANFLDEVFPLSVERHIAPYPEAKALKTTEMVPEAQKAIPGEITPEVFQPTELAKYHPETIQPTGVTKYPSEFGEAGLPAQMGVEWGVSAPGEMVEATKKTPPLWREVNSNLLSNFSPKYAEKFRGKVFDPRVAETIEGALHLATNDEAINKTLKFLDELTGVWRKITLATPEWIARNIFGLGLQAYMNDTPVLDIATMNKIIMAKGAKNTEALRNISIKTASGQIVSGEQLYNEMRLFQSIDTGLTGSAKANLFEHKITNVITAYANPVFRANAYFENIFRGGEYIKLRKQGFAAQDAARQVRFAYGDVNMLGTAEKTYGRLLIPFYGWYRYSLGFHLEKFAEQPGKYANLNKIFRNVSEASGTEKGMEYTLPIWAIESGAFFTGKKVKEGEKEPTYTFGIREGYDWTWDFYNLVNLLEISGYKYRDTAGKTITQLPPMFELPWGMSNPMIKMLVNVPFYITGVELDQFGRYRESDQMTNLLGLWMPEWQASLLKFIRPINTANAILAELGGTREGEASWTGVPGRGRPSIGREQAVIKLFSGLRGYEHKPKEQTEIDILTLKKDIEDLRGKLIKTALEQKEYEDVLKTAEAEGNSKKIQRQKSAIESLQLEYQSYENQINSYARVIDELLKILPEFSKGMTP